MYGTLICEDVGAFLVRSNDYLSWVENIVWVKQPFYLFESTICLVSVLHLYKFRSCKTVSVLTSYCSAYAYHSREKFSRNLSHQMFVFFLQYGSCVKVSVSGMPVYDNSDGVS